MNPPPDEVSASGDTHNGSTGLEAQPENCDVNGDINADPPRTSAWNRPSNGVFESGSVMGGSVSWPALSESTRPVPRSSSYSSGPIVEGTASSSQAPAVSQTFQRQVDTTNHVNSGSNHHPRPRSRNRGGVIGSSGGVIGSSGGGTSSGSGAPHNTLIRPSPLEPPPFPTYGVPLQFVSPPPDASMTATRPARGVVGPQPRIANGHAPNRSSIRRSNFGPRPRGEGLYHNNHGGRQDHDRRDILIPANIYPPLRFMYTGAPYYAPPVFPIPAIPPMGFANSDMSAIVYSPVSMPPPPPITTVPAPSSSSNGSSLEIMILNQIEYYFSGENLVKDRYLRTQMDENGWVPITLIASFHRIKRLTEDIPLILESLRNSTVVEVEGEGVRCRNGWNKWVLKSASPDNSVQTVADSDRFH